jgi:hypothetical protein
MKSRGDRQPHGIRNAAPLKSNQKQIAKRIIR